MVKKKQKRYFFTFFLILLLGSIGVFFTKTDAGFTIVYRILRQQVNQNYNFNFSIDNINSPLRTNLEADHFKFSNEDSTLVILIDTLNVNYRGIFELFGRRHLDRLHLIEPDIYIKVNSDKQNDQERMKINFPNFLVNIVKMENINLHLQLPDTLIDQKIENLEFHYSGRNKGALFSIKDLKVENEALGINIYDLSSEIVFKNDIVKLRNLNFMLNDSKISSNGKIRFIEPFRFQFGFNMQDFAIENYIDVPLIKDSDKIDVHLDLMGDLKEFTAMVDLKGTLNGKAINNFNFNLEYKDDYLHLLQASFKNSDTDISIYGSYGLKDKYITTTMTSHALTPSEWIETLPDFDFQGRLRATGYFNDRLKINYDFDCMDLYGLEKTTLQGNVLLYGIDNIVLDSTNFIYLPNGLLKARGSIQNLSTVDLDIYGDISLLSDLDIPQLGDVEAKDMYLTLKVLGEIKDPDIQMNFNLDTLKYDVLEVSKLNVSLFSNKTISEPGGAVLISFENAVYDSFLIGSLQTYVRVKQDSVLLDYFDISNEYYSMSLSGSIVDFKEFTINSMKGEYQSEEVFLLDPVTFILSDEGYSLSRFDILYRDALLYGSLDIAGDSLNGSLNVAGAELNSLPLVSTMIDSVEGILDLNLAIRGKLGSPVVDAGLLLKRAHAFGLDARRIRSQLHYENKMVFIDDVRFDIDEDTQIALEGKFPLKINFNSQKPIEILQEDSLDVDIDMANVALSKLLPFILPFPISGNANASGSITGTINDPIMDADLYVNDPVVMKIEGDSVKGQFHYSNERIFFNEVEIFVNNGRYFGNANLFLDLRLQPEGLRFIPDSSLYVYVEGQDDEMIYLTPFIEPMESFTGDLYTELEMTGNFNKTIKNGKVTIKKGHLVLGILGNEIENLEGEAIIKDNIMKVDLKGRLPSVSYTLAGVLGLESSNVKRKNNFNITGNMNMRYLIRPQFNLRLTGNQMSIVTLNENVNLTTGGVDLAITGRDTLNIAGDVTIQEGVIEFGFNRTAPETGAPPGNDKGIKTAYSLNAIIDKLYFRNQLLDATLNGEMVLQKFASENRTRMGGELFVTEGFFNYWASVFVLEEGSLILDQFENNHELNFIATKSITDEEGNKVDIIASISGELNNPEITFTDENNTMSQAMIVNYLTVGEIRSVIGGVTDGGSDVTALLSLAEVPLEQQAKKLAGAGGLDRIDIKGGTEGTYIDGTTALVIGGRIGRNFYLTYEGSPDDPYNMEFEYRLNNKVSIVGKANEESVSGAVRLRLQY
jgi:autotransporter translocation and assembly factor TamB